MYAFAKTLYFLLAFSALYVVTNAQCAEDCGMWMKCSPFVNMDPIFGLDNGKCRVFKSPCLFKMENCRLESQCYSAIIETSQAQCQASCPSCVNVPVAPLCAMFPYRNAQNENAADYVNFANLCEMEKAACNQAKAYIYNNEGACV